MQQADGSVEEESAGSGLRLLNFEDLLSAIDEKLDGAVKTQASWQRLRAVAQEIGGADASGFDPVGPEPWRLERLQVSDYRGVQNGDGLAIDFDPTPGITVMHGANGAGKSSIADALRTVLHGAPQETSSPTSGMKRPLWEPVHLAAGALEARVEVTLSRGSTRMSVTCTIGDSTEPQWSAIVDDGGVSLSVDLAGEWFSALASYHPVYAYADWERKVQTSGDLRGYLEGMLALGGCFAALSSEVTERGNRAREAKREWDSACKSAMQRIEVVDQDQRSDGEDVLARVPQPSVETDIDEWLREHELTDRTELDAEVTGSHQLELEETARDVLARYEALSPHSGTPAISLIPLLAELQASLALEEKHDDACPVCLSTDTNWRSTLDATVAASASRAAVDRQPLVAAIRELRRRASTTAEALGQLAPLCNGDTSRSIEHFTALSAQFCETSEAEDLAWSPAVREQAVALSGWILEEAFQVMMSHGISLTNRRRQWRRARARALEPFIDVFRREGPQAREAGLWAETAKRVDNLKDHLQKQREEALREQLVPQISDLLGDVDMRIEDLAIQKTQAKLELSSNSTPIGLGMLSAGQRNAVLLAPLLAVADEGPFGFLVLDDPVHAFDELRLDRLAKTLEPIAQRRRVIVLTHDQRLVEHLQSRPVATTTHSVLRHAESGAVTVTSRDQAWKILVDDAQSLVEGAAPFPDCRLTVTQAARGLCRQALDHAIREFVVTNAVTGARDVIHDLERLDADQVFTTKKRLKVAKKIVGEDGQDTLAVEQALQICAPHFEGWNAASHGNPDTSAVTMTEIAAAREACATLAGIAA